MNNIFEIFKEIKIEDMPTKTLENIMNLNVLAPIKGSIERVYEITQKYKSQENYDLNIIEASKDLLELQAIHIYISTHLGYFQAISANSENIRKLSEAKASIAIREKIEETNKTRGVPIRITETTINDISKILIEDKINLARENEIISRLVTNVSYSITDFTRILSSMLNREAQERRNNNE